MTGAIRITPRQYDAFQAAAMREFCARLDAMLPPERQGLRGEALAGFVRDAQSWGVTEEDDVANLARLSVERRAGFLQRPPAQAVLAKADSPAWLKLIQLAQLGPRE